MATMSSTTTIDVGNDFTRYPAGRYQKDGPGSGEQFRNEFLLPALASHDRVQIALDSTMGYGSSFLEEAFGGIVRLGVISSDEALSKFDLITSDTSLRLEIEAYISQAKPHL